MRYHIIQSSHQPSYMQLYLQLREDITGGAYAYGMRLPSKRLLAEEAGVSVITVGHAYELLIDEGYARAQERSGYYVCYRAGDLLPVAEPAEESGTEQAPDPDRVEMRGRAEGEGDPEEAFPFSVFARTMRRVLTQYQEKVMESSPPGGVSELRHALASYLARSRGINVSPDQILVGSGAEDLYGLLVPMLGRDRLYAIENPSYGKIRSIYEANGAAVDPLEMGPDGIRNSELLRTEATVLHVTPFNSYPSRVTATASKRAAYIRWALERDAVIIEDDYDSEFSELTKAEETLYSLEPERTVIYINTFSKTIASSMRMGYMVLPRALSERLKERISFYSCSVPVFEQYVLAQLIDNGDFERHINRVRRLRRRSSDPLRQGNATAAQADAVEMTPLRADAERIIDAGINAVLPGPAVEKEIRRLTVGDREIKPLLKRKGKLYLAAIGKAAWTMADAAVRALEDNGFLQKLAAGIVITKYGHVQGEIPCVECFEAGHPEPDENGFEATRRVVEMVAGLTADDTVLLLISGGGSALFEIPLIPYEEIKNVTHHLLMSGADITEINTVRKRLSAVKGGRFAALCAPAHVHNIILSDVLGDPIDMIASGPGWPDSSTGAEAVGVLERYGIRLTEKTRQLMTDEDPVAQKGAESKTEIKKEQKKQNNITATIIGNVEMLCEAVISQCRELGYETTLLTDHMTFEAREAGELLGVTARAYAGRGKKKAFIAGGETVVHVKGKGLGGRNQETALAAAEIISGLEGTAVFSIGSDGTDGPTDAAGGFADGTTAERMRAKGIDPAAALADNDSYHALDAVGGLIRTGPTGTNVNDVAVALVEG